MIQFSRYQCRACGKPALHVRSQYELPNIGYVVVLGFLSVDALLAHDAGVAPFCIAAAVAVAGLWVLHTVISLFTAGERFRCQDAARKPAHRNGPCRTGAG